MRSHSSELIGQRISVQIFSWTNYNLETIATPISAFSIQPCFEDDGSIVHDCIDGLKNSMTEVGYDPSLGYIHVHELTDEISSTNNTLNKSYKIIDGFRRMRLLRSSPLSTDSLIKVMSVFKSDGSKLSQWEYKVMRIRLNGAFRRNDNRPKQEHWTTVVKYIIGYSSFFYRQYGVEMINAFYKDISSELLNLRLLPATHIDTYYRYVRVSRMMLCYPSV